MRVLILGGDGFCGWPTALHLSARGHEVSIVDNQSRRRIDGELGAGSLTPIAAIQDRLCAWQEVSGQAIGLHDLTVGQDYDALLALLGTFRPDAVVHFAE
ncbi:MAG: NAD-dependent epimerase/dehydratase family protein, partial [Phenylobacterium sp.]